MKNNTASRHLDSHSQGVIYTLPAKHTTQAVEFQEITRTQRTRQSLAAKPPDLISRTAPYEIAHYGGTIASEQRKTQDKDGQMDEPTGYITRPTPCCQHRSMLFIEHHDRRNQLKQDVGDMTKKGPTKQHHTTSTEQTDRAPVQRRKA